MPFAVTLPSQPAGHRRRPKAPATVVLVALAALVLAMGLAGAPAAAADWTGTWDTRWLGGGARLYLRQDGDQVTGRYSAYSGRLEGAVDGNTLTGTWTAPKGSGSFEFILADDGQSFVGRFGKNQWWSGARIQPDHDRNLRALQATPAETLRTFLVAAEAVQNGRLEYQDDLIALLLFPDGAEVNHVRELGPLALLMDQFTVDPDIFDAERPEGDQSVVTLTRYDGRTLDLRFERLGQQWFMVAPSADDVRTMLDSILEESEGKRVAGAAGADMTTPRGTMETFLDAIRAGPATQEVAISTLDLSEMPPVIRDREALLVAEYLNEVLARISEVIFQVIPNDPRSREPFVYFTHPAGDIVLAPVATSDGVRWKFTPETLRSIRSLYAATENFPPAVRILPYDAHSKAPYFRIRALIASVAPVGLRSVGPLEIWQWVALTAVFIGAALAAFVIGALVVLLARLWRRDAGYRARAHVVWGIRLMAFGAVAYAGMTVLGLPSQFAGVVKTLAVLALILGSIPLEFWLIDRGRAGFSDAGLISARGDILASLLVGVIKVLVISANILLLAEALRIPYGAALAGLGMGGIAIALAARSTLENVISGFILFADRPVDVGEIGRFDGRIGTIEHIGLRATTIRTLERTLVAVPNSEFVNFHLENFTRRDRALMRETFALRSETTPDQLRYILAEIRKLLAAHPRVSTETARARLTGIVDNRFEIEVYAQIEETEWPDFLAAQEDVMLRLADIVEAAGTDFAFPGRTLYLGRDPGVDTDRGGEAGDTVAAWRREGRLPFPNLTAEEIAAIEGSIAYPPEGAPPLSEQAVPERTEAQVPRSRRFWPFSRIRRGRGEG